MNRWAGPVPQFPSPQGRHGPGRYHLKLYTVTGTAIDAANALLALFGMSALSYTYGPDDIYANGSAAGTYTVVVDTLTITWTNTGNVERCIRQ